MIQLSTFTATGLDLPAKTAGSTALDGLFASLLTAGIGEAAEAGGKILPASGKVLPDALPVEAQAAMPTLPMPREFALPAMLAMPTEQPAVPGEGPETLELALAQSVQTVRVEPVESLVAELVEPVSVEPVAVAAAELPEDAKVEPDAAEAAIVVAPLLLDIAKALAPAEADTAATQSLRTPAQQPTPADAKAQAATTTPAEAKAQAAAASVPAPAQAVLAALPLAGLAKPAADPAKAAEPASAAPRETAQPAAPARVQPVMELKLELGGERQPATGGDLPAARTASLAQAMPAFDGATVPTVTADPAAAVTSAKPAFDPAAALRPQELSTLVDRLVEARENARGTAAAVTVMHAEFGEVSLRFGQDNGNLTVAMANSDPGFARAVNAAVAADSSSAGETPFQGDRRDGSQQQASTRAGADSHNSSSDRGTGRERDSRDGRNDRSQPQPQAEGRAARQARGGIFA